MKADKVDLEVRAWKEREQEKAFFEKFGFPISEVKRYDVSKRTIEKKDGSLISMDGFDQ